MDWNEEQGRGEKALREIQTAQHLEVQKLRTALLLLLDHVDYTAGACGMNEPVAGALPKRILEMARAALSPSPKEPK